MIAKRYYVFLPHIIILTWLSVLYPLFSIFACEPLIR
jgi:hypothetical protein